MDADELDLALKRVLDTLRQRADYCYTCGQKAKSNAFENAISCILDELADYIKTDKDGA